MAEYRRGQGPDALPQGAASSLNALLPRPVDQAGYQDNDVPVEFARDSEPDVDEDDKGLSENMQVLVSPPDEGYQRPPVGSKGAPPRLSPETVRNLPRLYAAAQNPSSPPLLKAAYRFWLWRLEQEGR